MQMSMNFRRFHGDLWAFFWDFSFRVVVGADPYGFDDYSLFLRSFKPIPISSFRRTTDGRLRACGLCRPVRTITVGVGASPTRSQPIQNSSFRRTADGRPYGVVHHLFLWWKFFAHVFFCLLYFWQSIKRNFAHVFFCLLFFFKRKVGFSLQILNISCKKGVNVI